MLCCWLRIVAQMFKDIGIHEADSWDLLLAPGGLGRADFVDHQEPSLTMRTMMGAMTQLASF